QKYKKQKEPKRVFTWTYRIWNPNRWIVHKRNGYYSLKKKQESVVTTNYPFWRLLNLWHCFLSTLSNGLFYIVALNMWSGPFGIRALFSPGPLHPEKVLDTNTGKIVTDTGTTVHTVASRVRSIWSSVRSSRHDFATQPESGFHNSETSHN